jgi:AraC-like DNA-binding protein
MKTIELLISGNSVKQTSFEVGYEQPSALVELFRTVFGASPKAWTHSLRSQTGVISQES